jgi:hypothetical protein
MNIKRTGKPRKRRFSDLFDRRTNRTERALRAPGRNKTRITKRRFEQENRMPFPWEEMPVGAQSNITPINPRILLRALQIVRARVLLIQSGCCSQAVMESHLDDIDWLIGGALNIPAVNGRIGELVF